LVATLATADQTGGKQPARGPTHTPATARAIAAPVARKRRTWPLHMYTPAHLVILGLVVAAAGLYVRGQATNDARQAAEGDAAFAASLASRDLGQSVDVLQSTVARLALNPGLARILSDPGSCTLSFSSVGLFGSGRYDILTPDGSVVCSSEPRVLGGSGYQGAPWIDRALAGPLLMAPTRDRLGGAPGILSVGPAGRAVIVAAFVGFADLGSSLTEHYGGPRGLGFLVTSSDGDTAMASSIRPQTWSGHPLAGTAFARPVRGGSLETTDLDGIARLYMCASQQRAGLRPVARSMAPGRSPALLGTSTSCSRLSTTS
jgi:hypothetical protein